MRYIKDDIENGLVSDTIPYKCLCGSLLTVSDNDTLIECSNPNCIYKSSNSLAKSMKSLGISADVGEERAKLVYQYFDNITHPMDIFTSSFMIDQIPQYIQETDRKILKNIRDAIVMGLISIDKTGIPLWKFINAFNLKDIGEIRCQEIFTDFHDINEFYTSFHQNPNEFISNKILIDENSDTVISICEQLTNYENKIKEVSKFFKFKEKSINKTYTIAITGPIENITDTNGAPIKPRERIAEVLGNLYGVNIIITKPKKTKNFDYLIMDKDMTDCNKFNKTVEIENENNRKGLVVTSYEFEKIISSDTGIEMNIDRIKET